MGDFQQYKTIAFHLRLGLQVQPISRTFPGSLMYETSPALAVIDGILDGVASYAHVLPKNRLPLVREMTSRLSQHSHLAGRTWNSKKKIPDIL